MNKIKYFMFLLPLFIWISFANQNSRGLDWVDIISRQAWWADESLRHWDNKEYDVYKKQQAEYDKYLQELNDEDGSTSPDFDKIQKQKEIYQTRNDYLQTNYLSEFSIDKTLDLDWTNKLWWPISYKLNKNRIIVHHTANDGTKLKTKEDIVTFLRNTYRYHAIKNWWWDIWYNFVVDKFGNIYEWRSGWEWAVGAHAKWNNVQSIWISLIWNFENEQPSQAQLESLINLITNLSQKYGIYPYNKVTYHKESSTNPYIKDYVNFTIVGHKDAWFTACPGKNLYSQLDYVRKSVDDNLKLIKLVWFDVYQKKQSIVKINKTYYFPLENWQLKFDYNLPSSDIKCTLMDNSMNISSCSYDNGKISVSLSYNQPLASWTKKLIISSSNSYYIFNVSLLWQKDLNSALANKKQNYITKNKIKIPEINVQKITYKATLDDIKNFVTQKVRILLFELSTSFTNWEIVCNSKCSIDLDWQKFDNIGSLIVSEDWSDLNVSINSNYYNWKKIKISSSWEIVFSNYNRKSYAWIPWNTFKSDIYIQSEQVKYLDWKYRNKFSVINEISYEDYLRWIAEVDDNQPMEKAKAMALIIKNYTLFYINKKNIHPSIPQSASYNMIDDARIFQKFVWAWFERTAKNWYKALELVKWQIIMYNWFLPVLPYFNCSAWYIWAWSEKWWWYDTPYLTSKLDFASCSDFNWHWVWMSGKWAEFIANKWFGYQTILKYYYDWISFEKY